MESDNSLTNLELDTLIDDIDSEFFSFEFVPAITKVQRNSVGSLMRIVAEKVSDIFSSYRSEKISFEFSEVDTLVLNDFLESTSADSVLFAFDFDGVQCEINVSIEVYKMLSGVSNIDRKSMSSVDSKLCFDFVIKPILSELLKKFNSKSTTILNFRTPKVVDPKDVSFRSKKCVCIEFMIKGTELKSHISLVLPIDAFEKLVRLGVFSHPRRPLQNPFKYNASVMLDRIYLDPNIKLEVGSIIETTKSTDDFVEILKDGKKIGEGELVAVRDLFGVRLKK